MTDPVRGESSNPDVPGVAGFSGLADGTRGDTQAKEKNGVVGGNTSTGTASPGVPGGNGVFGFTVNPNASGVFGANNATVPVTAPGGSGVFGFANAPGAAGVFGANNRTDKGVGVQGNGPEAGVSGFSEGGDGLRAHSNHGNGASTFAHDANGTGLLAINDAKTAPTKTDGPPHGSGVLGVTTVPGSAGVFGANNDTNKGVGVQGNGPEAGVSGFSKDGDGVRGFTQSPRFATAGVHGGTSGPGAGVLGESVGGAGVLGKGTTDAGVVGIHGDPALQETTVGNDGAKAGVFGASDIGAGVLGYSRDKNVEAIAAFGGFKSLAMGKQLAGHFIGDVQVDGDIFLPGADCAEHFDVADGEGVEAGAVVVIDENGKLRHSNEAYDRKVAGVVSGAGQYRPGIILDKQCTSSHRVPIALVGKVYCRVDAQYSPIEAGDLLTTSPTPGHAMKAIDPVTCIGSIIGKALRAWHGGAGLIPILVTLR